MTDITFEEGYEELKRIVERLEREESIPVHEMVELYAKGKALDIELRRYLDEQEARIRQIESGEELPEYRVVAPSSGRPAEAGAGGSASGKTEKAPDATVEDAAPPLEGDELPF